MLATHRASALQRQSANMYGAHTSTATCPIARKYDRDGLGRPGPFPFPSNCALITLKLPMALTRPGRPAMSRDVETAMHFAISVTQVASNRSRSVSSNSTGIYPFTNHGKTAAKSGRMRRPTSDKHRAFAWPSMPRTARAPPPPNVWDPLLNSL